MAAADYRRRGYRVVDRNWRCAAGELDLIVTADDGRTVVFVEVRTRSGLAFGTPADSITVSKRRRWRRAAAAWLADPARARSAAPGAAVRFDLAAVGRAADGGALVVAIEDVA